MFGIEVGLNPETGEAEVAMPGGDRIAVAMDEPTHTALSARVTRVHVGGSPAGGWLPDEGGRECATVEAALLYAVEVVLEAVAQGDAERWEGWVFEVGSEYP